MVIDTSVIGAILFMEADAHDFELILARPERKLISAVTRLEMTCVFESSRGEVGRQKLERLLDWISADIVPVDLVQMSVGLDAYRTYGKGRHKAALNIGDCFSYALAKTRQDTLLFNGNDFALTDIVAA